MKKIFFFHLYFFCLIFLNSQAFAADNEHDIVSENSFRVLDISERTYDNGPAVAVLLSKPLNPEIRHDEHLRISDTKDMLKSAWILSDDGRTLWFPHVDAEMEYSVSVLETLKSADGLELGKRVSQSLTTRPVAPVISFASEGFLLPSDLNKGLPVITVNVNSVYIEFFKINEKGLVDFVNWKNTSGKKSYYKLSQAKNYGTMVYSGRFDMDVSKNRRTVYHIPIGENTALQEPGVYLAVMREPGEYDYNYQAAYFLVTDIGLHVKAYKNQSLVFASSLKTGQPLKGIILNFYDNSGSIIEKGKTDADGKYEYLKKIPGKVHLITARKGNQTGILPMQIPALDMSEFDLGKRKYQPREIFVYSPRNLYRPGETLTVSALLRNDDGNPVEPIPLQAKLFQPDRKEVKSFTWQVQELGSGDLNYYQTNISLANDAQTGKWNLKLWDDPSSKSPSANYIFHVEEFLPERMKLDLHAVPEFPENKDDLEISISGRYLYGAPASGNKTGARARVKAVRSLFDTLKGFEFGDIKDKSYKDMWDLPENKLDKLGNLTLNIPSRWQEINSPLSVRIAVDLFETGGRPVTRAVDKTIWPAKSLIGIRPLFDSKTSIDEGPVNFEVVKVKIDGTLETDKGLMVELIKEDRDYYWEFAESTGWIYKYTQKNYQYLTQDLNLIPGRATPLTLQLQNGQYVLAVKDPETNLTTSIRFRVGYWWYGEDQAGAARPDKVVMTLDQPSYKPGDIIKLTITPPHNGQALIAVEGEHPLWVKRLPVSSEGTIVEIPMLAGWNTHNIYISSIVFRPGDSKEKITPNRAAGLIHLPLDRKPRKLNINIDAPQKARPQAPMTVKLTADRLENRETFVTLAAVDTGILNITDFKTPDPIKYFFERRRYDVNNYDIYSKVIELMDGSPAALRYGGDADLAGGKRPENKVKLLSLFQAPVAFDENGEAWVSFNIPDFNGQLRLMALAFDTSNFGSAEKEVTIAAPVVTQLAMPRFLAPEDKSEFTLDIHNLSGEAQELNLMLNADGPVKLEQGEQTISLADQEKRTLSFPVSAKADYGTSRITLQLNGKDINLKRNWSLPVRPGYPATTRKVFKSLAQTQTLTLDPALVSDLIESTIDAELKISDKIPLLFQNAMKGLITYPYRCLEQTASRAYPLLYAAPEQIARYNLPIITAQERIARLEKAIVHIASMQLASGGFGLWNKNSPEAPWLSVYTADFLLTARDMGVNVPDTMLDKALKRMESYIKQGPPSDTYMDNQARDHVNFAVQSYAAYILSRLNRAPLGTLRTLYDNHHKKSGSCLPLAHLGIALKNMGDAKRSQKALEQAAAKRIDKNGYWGDYSSPVRDLALTTALFAEYRARGIKGFDTLITDLDNAVRQRQWTSTQEKYAIFKAGLILDQDQEKQWQGRLTISSKEIPIDKKGSYYADLSPQDIINGVSFTSENPEQLYVSAIIDGYTKNPLFKEDSRISISRKIYDLQGKPVERHEFKVGELLLVHLEISAKEWIPDALAADFLPAGFEAENQNLKHSFKLEDMTIDGKSIWKLKEQADILHEEYRDDRYVAAIRLNNYQLTHLFYLIRAVNPGSFSVPPAFVESMYRPEIRGIGETQPNIRVINKSR